MKKLKSGFTIIELLIVIVSFSAIFVISTQAVAQSLKSIRKVDASSKVRSTADNAIGSITRKLRVARTATCTTSRRVDFVDENKISSFFSCENVGVGGYIASGSAILTSDEIDVVECNFTCSSTPSSPTNVAISFKFRKAQSTSTEITEITAASSVTLRTY